MTDSTLVSITAVRVLSRYILELGFDTGETRVLDVEPILDLTGFEHVRADYDYFLQVHADEESGTIEWPDGENWAPESLYAKSKPAVPSSSTASIPA